jgi:type II secretory pathway component PulC
MTRRLLPFGISTLAGILAGVVILLVIDASLLRIPVLFDRKITSAVQKRESDAAQESAKDYKAVTERNLFRAKLQAEIPKQKSEKEIEEEALANIMKPMTLKGVMTGAQKRDFYAVIDRGGQKGVWTYEVGETIERGLTVTDIRKDAVIVEKGDFAAIIKLFAKAFERIPATAQAAVPAKEPATKEAPKTAKATSKAVDYNKELKKEGKTLVISRSLADKVREDNSVLLSALTIKLSTDSAGKPNGYKVVGVDKGSLAQRLGIMPDDVLQEVNGFSVKNSEDLKKAHEALKNASKFEIKVLRKSKMETLRYEIR